MTAQAVTLARILLEKGWLKKPFDPEDFKRAIIKQADTPAPPWFPERDLYKILARGAKENKFAWEAVCELAAKRIEQGRKLPPPLAAFSAAVLRGEAKRPRKGAAVKNYHRNFLLAAVVYELNDVCNINPTRNETSPANSGCDIVAEIASEMGEEISYDTVQKCWQEFKALLSSLEKNI